MKTEIDTFIDNCPFVDFSDENKVHNYSGKFLWDLNNSANQILYNSLYKKTQEDYSQLCNNNDLQSLALYNEEIRKIFYRIETKYIEKGKIAKHISILHKLILKSITKLSSIITLYCSKNYSDCYSIYRNIYEHFIIFSYVLKNEDISEAFIDHAFMSYYLMLQSNGNAEEDDKQKLSRYLEKYGDTFKYEYGWAQNKLKKNNKVTLTDLIRNCENENLINTFAFSYTYACKFVHATSYAVYTDDEDISRQISFLIRNTIEMLQYELCSFLDCLKMITKDKVLLKSLISEFTKLSVECIKHFEAVK
ncbi:hypothetical protein MSI_10720 [Treponema sp. JC4]|uniref:DUF5677 domain-containing protein n=1 Tax=Treponema sp. JC4 TaxID=1124982 RepID=UPI00025B0C2A|nr:DUF5677 domain-containing protein [Treponema sp. JC4]EID85354.1 hypothetical protein MSI_10720 [Treponema sp. JC4]